MKYVYRTKFSGPPSSASDGKKADQNHIELLGSTEVSAEIMNHEFLEATPNGQDTGAKKSIKWFRLGFCNWVVCNAKGIKKFCYKLYIHNLESSQQPYRSQSNYPHFTDEET